jgi:hypothetical protein
MIDDTADKKTRPVASTGDIGTRRHRWFRRGYQRCAEALRQGFYVEAIALIESMLGDRMESRLAWLREKKGDSTPVRFSTLEWLLARLGDLETDNDFMKQYGAIGEWKHKRNAAVHEMVKLPPDSAADWDGRYSELKGWAIDGYACLVRLDRSTNGDRKRNGVKRSATQSSLWPDGLPDTL